MPGTREPDTFSFTLTAITRDPDLARRADAAGVDRIGVDVERLLKRDRQRHIPDARISDHELDDLAALGASVRRAALFARLNSLHSQSHEEIDAAIAAGAAVVMLPYFTTPYEVERFVRLVDARARVVLLLETAAAVVRLHEILRVDGVHEIIVGLNDLRISTGVANHFEIVASDLMTTIAGRVLDRGLRFGFGGLARVDDVTLPIPPDLVIAQHARLGSRSAWLSRSFFNGAPDHLDLGDEVRRLRERLRYWIAQPADALDAEHARLRQHLNGLVFT
ncbi:MAG TPA: aldolase/citrate lyase family protein [Vicinamibacterales bacterium]|jgi:hypothetical protein